MHSQAMGQGDIGRAIRQITETAAQVLDVERSSVWRLVEEGTAIECIDLYERSHSRHGAGTKIRATDVPRYFEALQSERAIRADDARTDPRTSEFRHGYLEPLGITAMLDAPVFVRGKMVGVVCNEHTGTPRSWEYAEELLAGTFADFVALVLETEAWYEAQEDLRLQRDALEGKVQDRTRDLLDSEASIRSLLDSSPVSIVLTRVEDHKVVFANRHAATMFEVPLEAIAGKNAPDYWQDPADRAAFLERLFHQGRVDDLEARFRSQSGRQFWARLSAQRLRFDGQDTLLAAMVDITDQKRAHERLRELATHDALTGIYNRRHVEDLGRREIERAQRYQRPLTFAMLDADHFKAINDAHGHPVGDEVLRALSDRCAKTLRSNDVLGRYGGEEFVVIFPETTMEEASVVAERVRGAIAETPILVRDRSLVVTVSIGLAAFERGQDFRAVFERADSALYAAKQSGRNCIRTAPPA
jgi:diguanylate cyclase (GGDEF)-like protein/PAS domain S-box-containing protein